MTNGQPGKDKTMDEPEWANGLKQLYNSVVDEPLPDSFRDLLAQLDGDAQGESGARK
tara:strand:+ start:12268 stop:12438 length:171 start_codon:yes stop_codon:yes gene_type:complete